MRGDLFKISAQRGGANWTGGLLFVCFQFVLSGLVRISSY